MKTYSNPDSNLEREFDQLELKIKNKTVKSEDFESFLSNANNTFSKDGLSEKFEVEPKIESESYCKSVDKNFKNGNFQIKYKDSVFYASTISQEEELHYEPVCVYRSRDEPQFLEVPFKNKKPFSGVVNVNNLKPLNLSKETAIQLFTGSKNENQSNFKAFRVYREGELHTGEVTVIESDSNLDNIKFECKNGRIEEVKSIYKDGSEYSFLKFKQNGNLNGRIQNDKKGTIYVGEIKDFKPNGIGNLKKEYPNLTIYDDLDGIFKDGELYSGTKDIGKYGGDRYIHTYENGVDDKIIEINFQNGDFYKGEINESGFQHERAHGKGMMTRLNGDVEKGDFKDGKLFNGTIKDEDGKLIKELIGGKDRKLRLANVLKIQKGWRNSPLKKALEINKQKDLEIFNEENKHTKDSKFQNEMFGRYENPYNNSPCNEDKPKVRTLIEIERDMISKQNDLELAKFRREVKEKVKELKEAERTY